MQNDRETGLSAGESRDLRCTAGMMVPVSTEFDVPGADDAIIFADIVKSLGRDVRYALRGIYDLADGHFRRSGCGAARSGGGFVPCTRRRGGDDTLARDPAMLLSRRSGGALAWVGAAGTVPARAHARAGRLVATRPCSGAAEDVA